MKNNINLRYFRTAILLGILFLGTTTIPNSNFKTLNKVPALGLVYNKPSVAPISAATSNPYFHYVILDRSYVGFKEALAFKESRGRYSAVNKLGYLGKYQFGVSTLNLLGIYDTTSFLTNPELQEKAFLANAKRNKWVLRRDIKRFVGQKINGTVVTESGILAAAHLAGPGSVKRYLRSFGAIGFTDAFGTDISSYMNKFSSYDTSFIVPHQRPKATLL
jgi:hypothetical protein